MIAIAPCISHGTNEVAQAFEQMLPTIERVAAYGFRRVPYWRRQELITDTVSAAYVAYARLVELGRASLAYPSVLARYAIRRVLAGRCFGTKQNSRDVLSPLAQRRRGFSVELWSDREAHGDWELLIADRRADPGQIACCRIDFRSWLAQLNRFKRRVAIALAGGATTSEAGRQFLLSSARVSQLRGELAISWTAFQSLPLEHRDPRRSTTASR